MRINEKNVTESNITWNSNRSIICLTFNFSCWQSNNSLLFLFRRNCKSFPVDELTAFREYDRKSVYFYRLAGFIDIFFNLFAFVVVTSDDDDGTVSLFLTPNSSDFRFYFVDNIDNFDFSFSCCCFLFWFFPRFFFIF